MNKVLLQFIFMTMSLGLLAQEAQLKDIRLLYEDASKTRYACQRLFNLLPPDHPQTSPVLIGYRGCAHMMMAAHLYNPVAKLNEFSMGKALLEKAIKREPNNAELIYLRYSVQVNAPAFLGYRKQLSDDCAFLRDHVSSLQDQFLQQRIHLFLQAHPCH